MKPSLVIDRIFVRAGHVVSILFLIVVLIAFYEVVMRYLFNAPTMWVHETTSFLVSLAMLFGGIACYADEKHIAMTFIADSFPPKLRWLSMLFVEICTLVFSLMMTYGAFLSARDAFISPFGSFRMQTSGSALDPPFPAINKGFFFATCIMLVFLVVLHLLRHILTRTEQIEKMELEKKEKEKANA